MALFALLGLLVFGAVTLGGRMWIHYRRTGSTGVVLRSNASGFAGRAAAVLFVAAGGLGLCAAILAVLGAIQPIPLFDGTAVKRLGVVLFAVGFLCTFLSQRAMGASWRIGVDPSEKTRLVSTGPFAVSRNPIYVGVIVAMLGIVATIPNVPAVVGLAALVAAFEIQVRRVEEPWLLAGHGQSYARYASRVGRFLPGTGRIRNPNPKP